MPRTGPGVADNHLYSDLDGGPVLGGGAGCLQPPHRRMEYGRAPEDGAGACRAQHGVRPAPRAERRAPLRPRHAVHLDRVRPSLRGSRCAALHGFGGRCEGPGHISPIEFERRHSVRHERAATHRPARSVPFEAPRARSAHVPLLCCASNCDLRRHLHRLGKLCRGGHPGPSSHGGDERGRGNLIWFEALPFLASGTAMAIGVVAIVLGAAVATLPPASWASRLSLREALAYV